MRDNPHNWQVNLCGVKTPRFLGWATESGGEIVLFTQIRKGGAGGGGKARWMSTTLNVLGGCIHQIAKDKLTCFRVYNQSSNPCLSVS